MSNDRVYKAIKNCIRNKLVFAIPDRADATDLADDIFMGLSEPEVKLIRRRLNHLIEDVRGQSVTTGEGYADSWEKSSSRSNGTTESTGNSSGISKAEGYGTPFEQSHGKTRTFSRGQTAQVSTGESYGHTESENHNSGFSETTSRQQNSSSTSSESQTVHKHARAGDSDADRSVSTGGSETHSDGESHSRTDTGSDSYGSSDSYNHSKTRTEGSSKALAWSRSSSNSEGQSQSITSGMSSETSSSLSHSETVSSGTSRGTSQNHSRSVTDQPSTRHHPFWEEEPEHFTLEERRWRASESLMFQNTGCWYASTVSGRGFGTTRLPKKFYILRQQLLRLSNQLYEHHSLLPDEADRLLAEREQALLAVTNGARSTVSTVEQAGRADTSIWNRSNGDLSGGMAVGPVVENSPVARKRGPKTDIENHSKVRRIVSTYGQSWTSDDELYEICEKLDQDGVPVPKTWPTRNPPSRSWSRGLQNDPSLVIKAIKYHCQASA